jgi:hypothetical protein
MSSGFQEEHAFVQRMLVTVRQLASPVDDEKFLSRFERDQRHVPRPSQVIDALPAVRHERLQIPQLDALPRRRNDYHKAGRRQRHERLAAERMTLDDVEPVWQRRRTAAARDADADPAVRTGSKRAAFMD